MRGDLPNELDQGLSRLTLLVVGLSTLLSSRVRGISTPRFQTVTVVALLAGSSTGFVSEIRARM
jgi:hypothetical protein